MLFSMFLSYYLARYGRKTYVLLTACFIVLASLLSIILTFSYKNLFFFLYLPRFFSFPFFSALVLSRHRGPISYDIYLPGLKLVSISPQNAHLYGFMFFLSVNLAGAILGFWIGKQLTKKSLARNLFDFLSKSVVLSWIGCFVIFWITLYDMDLWQNPFYWHFHDFCMYRFWIPAVIATAIYGIYKWFSMKNESNVLST